MISHRPANLFPVVILVQCPAQRLSDDSLARKWGTFFLADFGLCNPLLTLKHGAYFGQRLHGTIHNPEYHVTLANLFLQSSSSDPDFVACRNCLAGFVQDFLGLVGFFKTCKSEPQLN